MDIESILVSLAVIGACVYLLFPRPTVIFVHKINYENLDKFGFKRISGSIWGKGSRLVRECQGGWEYTCSKHFGEWIPVNCMEDIN